MPNLTTGFPKRTGDLEADYENLYKWSVSLIDELKSIFCNLDSGNVSEAASVKAQNIDTTQARIKDAQINSLTADKLTAGTIDTGSINIKNEDDIGKIEISGQSIELWEDGSVRIAIGRDENGKYVFIVQNKDQTQGIYMNEDGKVIFTGNIAGGSITSDTTIDVETDALIGRNIVLRDRNEGTIGFENAAVISVDTGVLRISANNHRTIELNTNGPIELKCSSCKINGYEVMTE